MYKYYIYTRLCTRVIRQNKHVFSRKINRKTKKPIFKPVRAFVLSIPYNYTIFLIRAFYGAKNALKSNLAAFYSIYIWKYTQIFVFHAHTRTHIRIKTQTKHTMVITTTPAKKIFLKIFSFAIFEIFLLLSKIFFRRKWVICTKQLRLDLPPWGCNTF